MVLSGVSQSHGSSCRGRIGANEVGKRKEDENIKGERVRENRRDWQKQRIEK